MAQSPRVLRPKATGFTPRSISGLALWLDAADPQSLYTTDAGPVTAVSSPLDIAGCALWLDGADSSAASMTLNGSLVETWKDKSGNGRDFTATSTARPSLTASVINSRSAVTFNGSTSTLTGNTAAQDVIRNLAGYTVFTVLRTATVASGERLAFGVGPTVLFRIGQQDSRPFMGGRRVSGDTLESVTGTASDLSVGAAFIQTASVNHTSQSLTGLRNGATFASDATYMASGSSENVASSVSVGAQAGGTYGFWNGEIAEIIVYNTALSTADRARVEAYFAAKWAISGVHVPATATSDPVGAWLDKSGNARHATQSTAGNRPRIASTPVNGRRVAEWHSGTSRMTIASTAVLSNSMSLFAVIKRGPSNWGDGGGGGYGSILNMTNTAQGPQLQVDNGILNLRGGSNLSSFTPSGTVGVTQHAVISGVINNLATSLYANAALVDSDAASGSAGAAASSTVIGAYSASSGLGGPLNAEIAELIAYNRVLTAAERQRLERYLAARWGITLAPQVSNADAQDWVNRVYANGGTVSASTAAAVNTLCDSLDAASLRDRFYRLNLFCGTGLNAALVPLYRGPSLGGTQYGNTTDTNNAFVGVGTDYAETGASGGLTGNGSTKYLNTGFNVDQLPGAANCHLSSFITGTQDITSVRTLVGTIFNGVTDRYRLFLRTDSSTPPNYTLQIDLGKSEGVTQINRTNTSGGLLVGSRTSTTNLSLYANGASAGSPNTNAVAETTGASPFFVFARNGPTEYYNGRMAAYSIGAGMTAAQVTAYHTAIQAFQSAMGRV
jgi:hypothetical protein